MNYFAHGQAYIDHPYFLAGTAVPDWLGALDRRVRVRSKNALAFIHEADVSVSSLAAGIVRHHRDDQWFHCTPAFAQLSMEFSSKVREVLPDDPGMRPRFLGHILVEILLDATLIALQPQRLDAYYHALDQVDPQLVSRAVTRMASRPAEQLAPLIRRFLGERFLYDYLDDAKLLWRLNQVMRRVRLSLLPDQICDIFPWARQEVARHKDHLTQSEDNDWFAARSAPEKPVRFRF